MTAGGTALYQGLTGVPEMVSAAVALAQEQSFAFSCRPEQGRLLQLLARGRRGGVIGETGTGCGVGLAWLLSGAGADTPIFSVEHDPERARATARLFSSCPSVTIIEEDWPAILGHGPFDLLVLDGGGGGKAADTPVDPRRALTPFGMLVIDDFTPLSEWPPRHDGALDAARLHWLRHPDLLTAEIVLCPQMSTIIGTRRG